MPRALTLALLLMGMTFSGSVAAQPPRGGYSTNLQRSADTTQRRIDRQRAREVYQDLVLLEDEASAKIELGEGEVVLFDEIRGARVVEVNGVEVEGDGDRQEGWRRRRWSLEGSKLKLTIEVPVSYGNLVEKVACPKAPPGAVLYVWRGFYGTWFCQSPGT